MAKKMSNSWLTRETIHRFLSYLNVSAKRNSIFSINSEVTLHLSEAKHSVTEARIESV